MTKKTNNKVDNKVKSKDLKSKKTTQKAEKTEANKKQDNLENEEANIEEQAQDEIALLKASVEEYKDKYLRLSAEFDNYRRRTLNEKMEMTKSAGQDILVNLLPIVDDFERAMLSMKEAEDKEAIVSGVELIYNKFRDFLSQRGIKEIDAMHTDFDTDLHEALTKIPAPKKKLKGKVVDVIEKGYLLNDKVVRFSKVVIGE